MSLSEELCASISKALFVLLYSFINVFLHYYNFNVVSFLCVFFPHIMVYIAISSHALYTYKLYECKRISGCTGFYVSISDHS